MSDRLAHITRFWQILIAVLVAASLIFLEIVTYGPNIDGETPGLADVLQLVAFEGFVIGAFVLAAVGLFRWPRFGWWLSIVVDVLLGLISTWAIAGDLQDGYRAIREGYKATPDDLIIHVPVLLIGMTALGLLLLTRKRFLQTRISIGK